jgi:hypothetical protein
MMNRSSAASNVHLTGAPPVWIGGAVTARPRRLQQTRRMRFIAALIALAACTSPPLEERVAEPDVGLTGICGTAGAYEYAVAGTVRDDD